jgi:hypothetical protein
VPLQTPLAKEGLAVLGRSELEAAILKLQEDHARRKEAFDQACVPWREELFTIIISHIHIFHG